MESVARGQTWISADSYPLGNPPMASLDPGSKPHKVHESPLAPLPSCLLHKTVAAIINKSIMTVK